ncbi:MAG: tetratricopeptide repeat protein, partial [Candidatus Eisenbacteria bacterium]|nr:tetratricopeptide repeat protein [Candidatus Eisenbacteria bacterium]
MRGRVLWALVLGWLVAGAMPAPGQFRAPGAQVRREMRRVEELLAAGEANRAMAALHRVLRLRPGHVMAHRLLAELSLERHQWAIAGEHIDWLLNRYPGDQDALYLKSRLHFQRGERYQALALLRLLARHGARNPRVYLDLAGEQRRQGKKAEAAMTLHQGLESAREGALLVERAGQDWKDLRRPDQALAIWSSPLAGGSPQRLRLFQTAYLSQRLDDLAAAAAGYDSLIILAPRHKAALYNLALIQRRQGRDPVAAKTLRRLLAQHPQFAPAAAELARVYLTLERREEALAVLERLAATTRDPGYRQLALEALARL